VPFPVRTRAEIRDQLLAYWSAEYAARGETLLTSVGSDAYLLASQIAVVQEALDAQSEQTARDILPDLASTSALNRFGVVYGLPRPTGTRTTLTVQVTGAAPSTTYAIPSGTQMSFADGTLYDVTSASVTTSLSSVGNISLVSVDVGSSTARAIGDTLTFQTAPAGLNPTGTVTVVTAGADAATDDVYRQLILDRLQERPGAGNRADWRDWVRGYTGTEIADVYVYPLLEPPAVVPGPGNPSIPGCVTVVAVGPAQGNSVVNTRIVPIDNGSSRFTGATLPLIEGYIEGSLTSAGVPTSTGSQLRPVTMAPGSYTVEAIRTYSVNVSVQPLVTASNSPSFTVLPTVDATSTLTSVVVVGNYSSTGATDLSGKAAQVRVGTGLIRGGFQLTTLGTGTYNGGTGLTTFPVSTLLGFPIPGAASLLGAPANLAAIRTAIFDYFDALGPSDTTPASRWPNEDQDGRRSTLWRAALAGAIVAVDGVLTVNVVLPAVDTAPPWAKGVVTLGTLAIVAV